MGTAESRDDSNLSNYTKNSIFTLNLLLVWRDEQISAAKYEAEFLFYILSFIQNKQIGHSLKQQWCGSSQKKPQQKSYVLTIPVKTRMAPHTAHPVPPCTHP